MLKNIEISAYKSVDHASLNLTPLTILAGPNASGKSTVIQAILLALGGLDQRNRPYLNQLLSPYQQFEDVVCRWVLVDKIDVKLFSDNGSLSIILNREGLSVVQNEISYNYEENLFYLSASRLGPEEISSSDKLLTIGVNGQFSLGSYELKKDKPIDENIRVLPPKANANTLKSQLTYWLTYILDVETEVASEKITANSVRNSFNMSDIGEVTPLNTGAGNSFLAKILIMCLLAKPNDLLLIENPEIHLHPKAQSRLGEFLAFITNAGVQIIAETHCEHLINRVCYEIYKGNLPNESVVIHYKASMRESFESLFINNRGHFVDNQKNEIRFPSGFFDSTLNELLEIG